MMKRVVCRAFGTPDGVVVEKAPVPEPGPHDVLVRTTAANVSFVDRMIVGGRYQVRPPLPFTPGAVGAGEVVEAGSQVTHLTPGTSVVVLKSGYGTWATHMVAPAWAVVQPHLERARQEAAAQYKDLAATPRAAKQLTEIVPAANQGRVQFVFVASRAHQWGSFNPVDVTVELRTEPQPGDEDLLDRVAFDTWGNRGMVYVVDQERMPDTTPVAAVFRY